MAAEKLRDLSQPIDVALLDATVAAFYGTGSKEEVSYSPLFIPSLSLSLSALFFLEKVGHFYFKGYFQYTFKCGLVFYFCVISMWWSLGAFFFPSNFSSNIGERSFGNLGFTVCGFRVAI